MSVGIWVLIGGVLGVFFGYLLIAKVAKRVQWYVPSLTAAQIGRELQLGLSTVNALKLSLETRLSETDTLIQKLARLTDELDAMEELAVRVCEKQARSYAVQVVPQVTERLIREAADLVATHLEDGLIESSINWGSEYVLLHSLDDVRIRVNLTADSYDPQELRQAIVAALRWEVKDTSNVTRLADWLEKKQMSRQDFDAFVGRIGQELWNLRWSGVQALQRSEKRMPVPPTTPSAYGRGTRLLEGVE